MKEFTKNLRTIVPNKNSRTRAIHAPHKRSILKKLHDEYLKRVALVMSESKKYKAPFFKKFTHKAFVIQPEDLSGADMKGAGVIHKQKAYITHTTLPLPFSALKTFSLTQKLLLLGIPLALIWGLIAAPIGTLKATVTVLSLLYFIDTVFNLYLVIQSLNKKRELSFSEEELQSVDELKLPIYTILCPLYKEAHVVSQFLEAMEKLDWPKAKLDVIFLLEEDDQSTIQAFSELDLPSYARTVIVPHSMPKTKPKACNYGLSYAKGKYLVVYDAEDIPDPLQLKKAYLGFAKVPKEVQCLQAKLNYYNSGQNLLTRFFTAEYSLWFDVTLTGLQSLNSTIPLGGTSNHFRTKILRDLQGWDPFNVTEDADLGVRLFRKGFKTAIIDSTTLEEAASKRGIWLKQRSRWLKGYMQTYLVHMRNIRYFVKEKGLLHNAIFQMTVGGKILFILINPLLWVITILYFFQYHLVGPLLETIYVPPVSYFAVFSWIFGNFLFLYYYMIGAGKRGQWDIIKYVFLIPAYWLMLSAAGAIAFYQLLFKPHYWEKTTHGFHLAGVPDALAALAKIPKPSMPKLPEISWIPEPIIQPAYIPTGKVMPAYTPVAPVKPRRDYGLILAQQIAKYKNLAKSLFTFEFTKPNFGALLPSPRFALRFAPVVFLMTLDAVAVSFLLSPAQAYQYLVLSFVAKALLLLVEFVSFKEKGNILENNMSSLFGLLDTASTKAWKEQRMRILIFNWRDTKHVYAGGAEVYIHELAKRWVKDGNQVTIFAGNDHHNLPYEKTNGVEIFRRGGIYTVYAFALLYYLFKFRGNYDVVVDCENGIPFFTPLFTRLPIVLLIHHVHQEIFRTFLKFPLNHIATFLEGTIMPLVYRNKTVVTVSDSSRSEIFKLGFTEAHNIAIVANGLSTNLSVTHAKTNYPSFVYLGRLKDYKNIDVAIKAFADVVRTHKDAVLSIVGSGEEHNKLVKLALKLKLGNSIRFLGRVSEKEKLELLASSWVMLQPSQIEGWGITVIEANAAGTPVIASDVSGLRDSVLNGETGILVEAGNVRQFGFAMKELIGDSALRATLSQNALRWSLGFDWDKSADEFYKIIGDSLQGHPRHVKNTFFEPVLALK